MWVARSTRGKAAARVGVPHLQPVALELLADARADAQLERCAALPRGRGDHVARQHDLGRLHGKVPFLAMLAALDHGPPRRDAG